LRLADGEPVQKALPERVYADMVQSFERQYPVTGHCERKGGCWITEGVPRTGLSWSADGAFGLPPRGGWSVGFISIGTLRLGVINEFQYNWYNAAYSSAAVVSDIKRESAPFFVAYQFPPALVGSVLCIKGTSLWQTGANDFVRFTDNETSCRQI